MKRVCLFAGYNYSNILSEYVVDYLAELSQYADVYYLADGSLEQEELKKIEPFVHGAWVISHGGYDFYSWKLLATEYVGWDTISAYDEVVFANDSCFCVNSFKPVFEQMDLNSSADIWGLSAADELNISITSDFDSYLKKKAEHFFIGSYFWVVRKAFISNPEFTKFINGIEILPSRMDVYRKYELGIIKVTFSAKAQLAVWDKMIWRYSTSYMRDAFNLLKSGYPLLKVRIFVDNIGGQTLMNELADATLPFCSVDYSKYIKQIREERHIITSIKTKKKNKNKLKRFVNYLLPPIISDLFRIRKLRKCVFFFQQAVLYVTPRILVDVLVTLQSFTSTFFRLLVKRNNVKSRDSHRFSLIPRPKHGGYYPCHIKNYELIQKKRVSNILNAETIVVFFNVMRATVSGGMLSIDRFVNHSLSIAEANGFKVVQSNLPLDHACITNPFFDYSSEPIDFKYISEYTKPKKLLLNIPECFIPDFLRDISEKNYVWLWSIPELSINILNQSDELMPPQCYIEELRTLCNNRLTITAAHQRYCTKQKAAQYNCPMYLLTPFLPDFYRTDVNNKEKIIVLSPDVNEYKSQVVELLSKELSDYKIITVRKLTLEEYKRLISKAMFAITFGEGYDGYFIEPYLSDSIAFGVRNSNFFPKDFAEIPTVYNSWKELLRSIVNDIRTYERDTELYRKVSNQAEEEIRKYTNNKQSIIDLTALYDRFLSISSSISIR